MSFTLFSGQAFGSFQWFKQCLKKGRYGYEYMNRCHPGVWKPKARTHFKNNWPFYINGFLLSVPLIYNATKSNIKLPEKDEDRYPGRVLLPGMAVLDQETGVHYFSNDELGQYKISFNDGKILDAAGNLLTMGKKGIFTMDMTGNIYVYEYRVSPMCDRVRHTSLSRGAPVAGAGEMFVVDGVLLQLNNLSGHYHPNRSQHENVVNELQYQGVLNPLDMKEEFNGLIINWTRF